MKKYVVLTFLFAAIVSPILFSFAALFLEMQIAAVRSLPLVAKFFIEAFVLGVLWIPYACFAMRGQKGPQTLFAALVPVLAPFIVFMGAWVVVIGLSDYVLADSLMQTALLVLLLPYFYPQLLTFMEGVFSATPLAISVLTACMALFVVMARLIRKRSLRPNARLVLCLAVCFALGAAAAYQCHDRTRSILPRAERDVARVEHNVNSYEYQPFMQNNLPSLGMPAWLSIDGDYPRLDGATAAYPMYAAMVEAVYKGLDPTSFHRYVFCSRTSTAYDNLIDGKADIIFVAEPSVHHQELAASRGIELELTPIAREAFVFLVNRDNPVTSLTVAQVQDIYQKKVTNWREVGGADEPIMTFQRPANSGSQTVMLASVMSGKTLPSPIQEEVAREMGGIIQRVAEYRNYSSAIGYSFRFFVTGMHPSPDIRMLAIEGVEPTVENIRSGRYPFTVNVYAVTAGSENPNVAALLKWILSDEGQELIEKCGYVPR